MRSTLLSITALAAAVTLGGCGASSPATPVGASATTTGSGAGQGKGGANGTGRIPGTSGLIAAVSGSTMQVQGNNEQTTVSWSGTTTFTKTVPGAPADIVVGSCVVVRDAVAAPGATAGPSSSSAPTTASDVQISQPVGGRCTATGFGAPGAGGGGARGSRPTGTNTLPPGTSGTPGGGRPKGGGTAGPGGGAGGRGAAGLGVVGTVTAVNGSSLTVRREVRQNGTTTATPSKDASVTTTSATTYAKVVQAAGPDVTVGQCVTAMGKADETGAVAATSIALRPAANGACALGVPGGRRAGRPSGTTTGAAHG